VIRRDLEGVSGVASCEQAEPGSPKHAFGQEMFGADPLLADPANGDFRFEPQPDHPGNAFDKDSGVH